MLWVDEINADIALVPLGLLVAVPAPGATNDLLAPLVLVTADHTVMEHHHATTPREELLEAPTLVAGDLHAVGGINHQHVGGLKLGCCREFPGTAGGDSPLGEELGPFTQESRVIVLVGAVGFDTAANEHAKRSGMETEGDGQQGPHRQEGSQELFHGFSQTTQIADAVTDARIQGRIDPLGTHDGKGEPGQSMEALWDLQYRILRGVLCVDGTLECQRCTSAQPGQSAESFRAARTARGQKEAEKRLKCSSSEIPRPTPQSKSSYPIILWPDRSEQQLGRWFDVAFEAGGIRGHDLRVHDRLF